MGFTGTREGCTGKQLTTFARILREKAPTEFHHGDCIGADAEAFKIAKYHRIRTKGHPPKLEYYRAFCPSDENAVPADFITRDRHIVNETDELVACPKGVTEIKIGSGTWTTVRYARLCGKRVTIIWPDGSTKVEENSREE